MNRLILLCKHILIFPIRAYQFLLSPWLGHWCRFTPSCSNYAIEAIKTRGPLLGLFYAIKRILRCHPWCKGGHDPVAQPPERRMHNSPARPPSLPRNHSD